MVGCGGQERGELKKEYRNWRGGGRESGGLGSRSAGSLFLVIDILIASPGMIQYDNTSARDKNSMREGELHVPTAHQDRRPPTADTRLSPSRRHSAL